MAVYCHSEMFFSMFLGQYVHIVLFQLVALLENKKLFSAKKNDVHSSQRSKVVTSTYVFIFGSVSKVVTAITY